MCALAHLCACVYWECTIVHPMLVLRSSVHYTVVLLGVCTTPAVLLGVYTGGVCVGGWVGGLFVYVHFCC